MTATAFFSSSLAWLSSWFATVGTIILSFFSSISASALSRFEQVVIYVVAIVIYIIAFVQAIVTFDYGLGEYLLVSIIESVLFHVTAIIKSISTKDAIIGVTIGVTIVVYVSILRFLLFRPSFHGRDDGHNGTTTVTSFSLVSAPVFPWFKSVIFGVAKYPKSSLRRPRYGGNGNPAAVVLMHPTDTLATINRKWCQHMAAEIRTCVSFAPDVEFNGGKPSSGGTVYFEDAAIFWWSAEEEHGFMARDDPEYLFNNETGLFDIGDDDDDDGLDFGGFDDEPELVADADVAGHDIDDDDDADVDDTGLED